MSRGGDYMLLRAGYSLRVDEPILVGFGCCGLSQYEVMQIDIFKPITA